MSDNHEQYYRGDHHSHVMGECRVCEFRFDLLRGVDCPACRAERVRKIFRPLNEMRTTEALQKRLDASMGEIEGMVDAQKQGYRWHGPQPYAYVDKPRLPKDCTMPPADQQVYQLRRLFRL